MQISLGKILSLLVVIGYAVLATAYAGLPGSNWCAGFLVPLALIWFPEEIGSLTGYFPTGYVNVQTPGAIISFIGWFFLVGLPALLYLVRKFVI